MLKNKQLPVIDNLDRRLNWIAYQISEVEGSISAARTARWPDRGIVPFLKQRARLYREQAHVIALKSKREQEKQERIKQAKLGRLVAKYNHK